MAFKIVAFALVYCILSTTAVGLDHQAKNFDQDYILNGIRTVGLGGSPGFLSVYESTSFPILAGVQGSYSPTLHPVAAAGRLGKGRIVGLGHDNFLTPEDSNANPKTDKDNFIFNVLKWASAGALTSAAVLPASVGDDNALIAYLTGRGVKATAIELEDLPNIVSLKQYSVVCIDYFFDAEAVPILREYVENGGGLVIAVTNWAYSYFQKVEGHFGSNWAPNMISKDAGFVWRNDEGDSISGHTGPGSAFNASQNLLADTSFAEAWSNTRDFLVSGVPSESSKLLQYASIFEAGVHAVPTDATFFTDAQIYEDALNFTDVSGQPIPSEAEPVTTNEDKLKLQVFRGLSSNVLKTEDIQAHPSADIFPGKPSSTYQTNEVMTFVTSEQPKTSGVKNYVTHSRNRCNQLTPASKSVPATLEAEINEDVTFPVWYSSGFYATAGQAVTIRVTSGPTELPPMTLQVGTHTDDISRHEKWYRPPRIVSRAAFQDGVASIKSSYGGSVYVISSDPLPANVQFTVGGAINAPLFRLDVTTNAQWSETIRNYPGPWAELVTDKIVLSAPSTSVRNLDDPEALMRFWDQVMDAIADLAAIPRTRHHAERMVPDVQISAGFMHSGYPIMTFMNEGNMALNLTFLRAEGSWGHFHEIGHNHQQSTWTFDGTGEVTCNLFALYVFETVLNIPAENAQEHMRPDVYIPDVQKYIDKDLDFQHWKSEPWLALMLYVQLQREYGWDAYKSVFAQYHELNESDPMYPGSEEDKMNLWCLMFSETVQQNLYDFFISWGMPISPNVGDQLAKFPTANISMLDLLNDK